jgi:hypothetical protein
MSNKPTELELIPKSTAEKLDTHVKKIKTFIQGQRKGAAEQFGYAFLAGRQLLQAKSDLPNGNSKDANAGFQKWVEASFPAITHRTATNWMVFAESIMARVELDAPKSPLLLGVGKLNVKTRNSILDIVPKVMDGKGMMTFMRATRLLLDPEKPEAIPPKPLTAQEKNKAKAEQAKRVWKAIRTDLGTGLKVIKRLEATDLKQMLDDLVDAGNKIREQLKKLKVEPEKETA